ncbi:hypothetical protein [Paucilactobacillus kaifaensis]|uniref:hypothetical protein n=1 Tax=Paucilactobacillus kaifaensis TaxID=2559921 RepID=UPI0010F73650|nr:hypothetical protein [Paucilactobacillus kaifaensis]
MNMAYMDYNEYKELMKSANYKESLAVKAMLGRAKYYSYVQKKLQATFNKHPSDSLQKFIRQYDTKRIEDVWQAFWIAEQEHEQGWQFIEDGETYLSALLIKYEGDISRASESEQLSNDLVVLLDRLDTEQRQGE